MATNLEQFVENLSQTGLMSADEVSTLCDALPPEERPADAKALARLLVRQGKLTKYQATAIYEGKHKHLVFGEYVILDRLGAGGMGVVFKARHRRMDRVVAIKVLPAEAMKSPAAVERFYREVRAAARLSHRNIVTAHDAGEHHGMHYLVMEYVEGKDLGQVVAENGPLPVEQAVECIAQAAEGLEYAHGMGVIHRDIKPGNLLLSTSGLVKILDMGLALMGESLAPDVTTAAQLTQSGQIMGTVDYMSPEQAQDTHRADERSDIYSLGCTLYRLLTGEPPYPGDTMMNRMMAHVQAPIPSLRDRRPDVPEALDAVFQRMIAKKPADRQQSMREVIDELAPFLPSGVSGTPRSSTGGTSQSMDAMGVEGAKSSGSSVRTTSRPTVKAGEDTITQQTESTNPEVAAGPPSAGSRPGSISSLVVTLRRPRMRILAAAGLVAAIGLATAGWFLFFRGGTPPNKADSISGATPSGRLSEGTTAGQEWSGNGLAMKFCWCPPGKFAMGEGETQVDVTLTRGFWLGKYEVTQAEYRQVMKSNPSHFSATGAGKNLVVGVDTDKLPVEQVSWNDATEYCRALSEQEQRAGRLPAGWEYGLPTEAQWEYACRAGTQTVYSFGDVDSRLAEYAWYDANSEKRSHEVGQKLPNPWGLHDMHGNVWECCRDWYQDKLPGGADPEVTKEAANRVLRGGSWVIEGRHCRSAIRDGSMPGARHASYGFRLALVQSGK
jgi:serine/threonine protein kinase